MADMKPPETRQQQRARAAYGCVCEMKDKRPDEYVQFAKKFPALVHTCGLAQAVAFAQAKQRADYLSRLAKVMKLKDSNELANSSRNSDIVMYQRYSHEAIASATWLKRYAEALLEKEEKNASVS